MYPKSFNDLVEGFKKFPGIGGKTAERLAFSVLESDLDDAVSFSKSIVEAKSKIKKCSKCGALTEDDVCYICKDPTRDSNVMVVVEDPKSVFLFEKIGNFKGLYHVLGGLISPIDDIGPEDLNIGGLVNRVKENNVKEVVLAIKSGIEADTTALYIKKVLESSSVTVTRIASGIPIGADMEYVDSLTLETALKNRNEVLNIN